VILSNRKKAEEESKRKQNEKESEDESKCPANEGAPFSKRK
jgi:hypothetical protein